MSLSKNIYTCISLAMLAFFLASCGQEDQNSAIEEKENEIIVVEPEDGFLRQQILETEEQNRRREEEYTKNMENIIVPEDLENTEETMSEEDIITSNQEDKIKIKQNLITKTFDIEYLAPPGREEIEIVISAQDGKISEVKAIPKGVNDMSKKIQNGFALAINSELAGKKISDLEELAVVAGASLTTKGFNSMIPEIKNAY